MTQVLVVCAAGASSTFLVRRLSDLAAEAGLSWSFAPSSVDSIRDDSTAIIAVSSHIATPEVLDNLRFKGMSHIVLPDSVRGGFGAEKALAELVSFVGENSGNTGSQVEPHGLEGID